MPMSHNGRLELELFDVRGRPLADRVTIRLRHHVFDEECRIDDQDGTRHILIRDLRTEPQGLYRLEVMARSYWSVARFVTIPSSGHLRQAVTLPIRPTHASPVFQPYDALDERVRGVLERSLVPRYEGCVGPVLYEALSPEETAGLLNIAKKSLRTPFRNGGDLLRHSTLVDIREDRCFVEVPDAVITQMTDLVEAEVFRLVDGSLHDAPSGFLPAGSFKTPDAFGNLQMTFFRSTDRVVAEIDIDDAAGLGHVFQVLRNHFTGKPTHPYNIHQILLVHQQLDPGYDLVPVSR
jgi:hypothetical protein